MLSAYIYAEYTASQIDKNLESEIAISSTKNVEHDFSIEGNNSSDSIDYLQQIILNNKIEQHRLNAEIKKLREYENMVLFPVSFPLRMLILFIIIAIVAYFLSRNKALIRNKIKSEYQAKQRKAELQNSVLLLSKRNEDIDDLLRQLAQIELNPSSEEVSALIVKLKHNRSIENNWLSYLNTFEAVNPKFFSTIEKMGISLTTSEKRLCAFISQDLTINQIANIINVNPNSVEKARYRLRKKFKLSKEQNLNDFIKAI